MAATTPTYTSLPPFPPFDSETEPQHLGITWMRWKKKFDNFLLALKETDSKQQRVLLIHYMGDNTNEIFDTLDNTGDDYGTAVAALTKHFTPTQNTEYETYLFRRLKQMEGEPLDQFNTRLRKKAANCDFANPEREIKAQIITGCLSHRLRKHALQTPSTTLTEILAYGRANETAEKHAFEMEKDTGSTVNAITRRTYQARAEHPLPIDRKSNYRQNTNANRTQERKCGFCNEEWHQEGLKACKARGQTCKNCGIINHFAKACRAKRRQQSDNRGTQPRHQTYSRQTAERRNKEEINNVKDIEENTSEYLYINQTSDNNNVNKKQATINLNILGQQVTFIIDSGATIDILQKSDFDSIYPKPTLQPTNTNVYAYGAKTPMKILGTLPIILKHHQQQWETKLHVTDEPGPSLIGKTTAVSLKLIQFSFAIHNNSLSILDQYPNLFTGIGKHKNIQVKLHIDEEVTPISLKHRRVPFHLRKKVEQEIKNLEAKDIIEKVPQSEPTPWVSPIVIIPKKDSNDICICIDMRQANLAIQRERHVTPTIDDIIYDLNGSTTFSKLDLAKGYHQLELSPESRYVTTFSTHVGLYRYKRLNFGVNAAAETFQNAIATTLQGIKGSMNISDDILIYGKTQEEHDKALHQTLKRLQETGLTLNRDKCTLNREHLKFLGYIFSASGITPDPSKVQTIITMPNPTNPTEVRSFLGMVNFCTRFLPHLASASKPLRILTTKNTSWTWSEEQQQAIDVIKTKISEMTSLAYFDNNKTLELWTDASPIGLGALLIQKDNNHTGQVLAFASHALSPTEERYSQIEREALAVTWAIEHFRIYLLGSQFSVITDHKPLITIFNNPRSQPSARLERWRLRLQPYSFTVFYKPGKENPADYMSRHPSRTLKSGLETQERADNYANFMIHHATPKAIMLEEVKQQTIEDPTLQHIITNLIKGNWKTPIPDTIEKKDIEAYQKIKHELSTNKEKSILLRGPRLILPTTIKQKAIDIAHLGHLGITKTKAIIREKTWFRGIDKMIEDTIHKCLECNAVTNTEARAPLQPTPLPQRPWQRLNVDHKGPLPTGEHLLVIVDQFSRFPIVEIVKSTSVNANLSTLDNIFSTFGIPEEIITDNGPPFNSREFKEFLTNMGIKHHKITPYWPQANGEAERFNRTMSKILKIIDYNQDNWKQHLNHLLRNYRTSPHGTTGTTPSELLFGYKMRTRLPDIRQIPIDYENIKETDTGKKEQSQKYYDQHHHIDKKPPQIGDTVIVKQQQKSKMMTPYNPRPYKVTAVKGTMISATRSQHHITRNQSQFKTIPTMEIKDEPENPDDDLITEQIVQNRGEQENNNEKDRMGKTKYNLRSSTKPPARLIAEI